MSTHKKLIFYILLFVLTFSSTKTASSEDIRIKGESLPLIKGAVLISKTGNQNNGSLDYMIEEDSDSIISFYNNYFQKAGWQIVGEPVGEDSYSAILYKDQKGIAFEVRRYDGKYLLRFQW